MENSVVIHNGVELHGVQLAPQSEINNLQIQSFIQDPVFIEDLTIEQSIQSSSTINS
jgi:hypothetical protein